MTSHAGSGRYVAVVGPSRATAAELELAQEVGRLLGEASAIVVTGGLGGVMEAASRGAAQAGGQTLGLLPGNDRAAANAWVRMSVPTGLGEMRNALLVRTSEALVAVGGSWGTLSEVALAVRTGVPVVAIGGWTLPEPGVAAAVSADDAVRQALQALDG